MELLSVTAVLVTRGNVDMQPVLDSLPPEWPVVIWDNSQRPERLVSGRYAALAEVETPLVYVQDDDVIVSNPGGIVGAHRHGHVVCNMPQEFRPHYPDSALVGFGACFHPELPAAAFQHFWLGPNGRALKLDDCFCMHPDESALFQREADTVFTTLTPRILVDVPKTDREFASDPDRLWKQPDHHRQRARMLELARKVRDS